MDYDALYWRDELNRYQDQFRKFTEQGKKIVKRYRDERKDTENNEAKFNILWSNIQTLKPAIYSRVPKVEVSRIFKDQNDAARVASMVLERSIEFELKHYGDYHDSLSQSIDDRLLTGRGISWVRYEPETETIDAEPMLSEDVEEGGEYGDEETEQESGEPYEQIVNERSIVDYVYWQDFAHAPARTWEECTWVARRVYMSEKEGEKRFGDDFREVPRNHIPSGADEKSLSDNVKKAEVWEIWCKESDKVYWIAHGHDKLLDERDDPLELENFFPCPKPIFATITTDSLVPVADFILYQDQADEIDEITSRIRHLTKALKVMGVYAADEAALTRLMKEGSDATLIPITNWGAFLEKGGLGQAIQFVPLGDVVSTLQQLYAAREACKQIIYETTGLSDIIRGASIANETATAQQIKSQFASLRLGAMKDDVARFARDILRMKAQIICDKYQPETILKISGIANTPDAQFAPQAIALLKNEPLRNFSIDIEADTLVELDEQGEKQSRMEFLNAASGFLREAVNAGAQSPEMIPLLGQMLMFGLRGFKVGRELEGTFERTIEQMGAKQQQQGQPPNPEIIKAQMQQQSDAAKMQHEMQIKAQEIQMEMQAKQQEAQVEAQKHQVEVQAEMQRHQLLMQNNMELERMRQEYENQRQRERIAADLEIARMKTTVDAAQVVSDMNTMESGGV